MPHPLLIGNRWVRTPETLPVINPYTGEEFDRVPLGNEGLLEEAIVAAEEAYRKTRRESADARAELLNAIASGIQRVKSDFSQAIMREAGKPITFAEAEVSRAIMTFRTAAEEARRANGEVLPLDALPPGRSHFGVVRRFPMGVIGAITPFNFPLNLVAHKVAPCIATGNTMVLKPASKTPLCSLLLAQVLMESGMPEGQVNVVTCTNDAVGKLIRDERVKKISFTGSPTVGWKLKEQCGRKHITLELGGNAGVIIHEDADLGTVVPLVALGAFASAGQSCISVQRVFIHHARYDEFRHRLIGHIREKIKTGDPKLRDTVVGPMINADALKQIRGRIDNALAAGAKLVQGGQVNGNCLEATVLEDVDPSLEICAEEAFAPVCTLHRYNDFPSALAMVNDSRFGLQAGVFTNDLNLMFQAYEALDVGGVLVNEVPTWRVENMPYGGVKESGFGREGVRYAMEQMTEPKSLIVKLAR